MAKAQEKTASRAVRPIAPPPLSQHLRELASRPHAWAVIARNLIPVVGIYAFGWSVALAVFNYWVRRADRSRGDRCCSYSACAARDAAEIGECHVGGPEPRARHSHVDFPRRHCRSAVLDRADSASRSAAWQRTTSPSGGFAGTLVHLRRARRRAFLEGVPIRL